ncbi:amino acid--tRNA ligase-related protein [Candidatus Vidania fulgoroideorum]
MKYKIGRVIGKRDMGGVIFIDIIYKVEILKIKVRRQNKEVFSISKNIKLGDIIKIEIIKDIIDKKEANYEVRKVEIISKNNLYLPDKRKNISNKKSIYKRRYVNLGTNIKEKKTILTRFKIIEYIRKFMYREKFLEVETNIINRNIEGANCESFKIKSKVMEKELFLRISPEINIKKMLISGFQNIFEIGKNFRNEGLSKIHHPEFTTIEFYKVDKNYKWGIEFTKKLIINVIEELKREKLIDSFKLGEFKTITLRKSIIKYGDISIEEIEKKEVLLNKIKSISKHKYNEVVGFSKNMLQLTYFEVAIQRKLIKPTFITEFPIEDSILAKKKNKEIAERYELYILGIEIANGFTELTNYKEQRKRFKEQEKSNKKKINNEFIEALKFGMPKATGCGIGIDRLVMILLNKKNIRDVIPFIEIRN